MDPSAALLAGLVAGLAIAMQIGAVSVLLVETAVVGGPRVGVAAGLGVATIDFMFAAVAAAAGGAAGAALAGQEDAIRLIAAGALAAMAIHGLATGWRERANAPATGDPDAVDAFGSVDSRGRARSHYARFVAITAVNPLTIASFAAITASLSLGGLDAAAAFVLGVGLASAVWHVALTLAAGHAGRWITPRIRRGFTFAGRLAVLAIAAHLALAAV